MKKIKTFLALALALSMCASFAACGDNADSEDESKAEKKTAATSAAAVEKESGEAAESKAEAEESTAESADNGSDAAESEAEEEAEAVFTFDDCEAFVELLRGAANMDEADKMIAEKFDIDADSTEVTEAHLTDPDFDLYAIKYTLSTPFDVFGKDEGDNPTPPISGIYISSADKSLSPDRITFHMEETYEQRREYEDITAYTRVHAVNSAIRGVISDKYGLPTDGVWYPDGKDYCIYIDDIEYTGHELTDWYDVIFSYVF